MPEAPSTNPETAERRPPSVLVLTKDEELNIEACLECLSFSDDVVVLDSLSTDRTVELAERFPNVRVIQRPFDIEYKQRNFGLHEIEYKNPWLYICDADERVPTDLREELLRVVNDPGLGHAAYRLRYKNIYMGSWIKRATNYPVWIIRLLRPDKVTYEVRPTNVHPIVDGTIGDLRSHFIHYSFNTGLRRWLDKHNFYSTQEALGAVGVRTHRPPGLGRLLSSDAMAKRRAIKDFSFFLRGRAVWRFLYNYIWRLGFLDGLAGFHYCAMISMYEYWIELKIREQEKGWRQRTDDYVAEKLVEAPA